MLHQPDDLGIDCDYLGGERLIIVTIVKHRWILQVHLEDKTFFLVVCNPMIKSAEVEDGDPAIRVIHKQFYFTALIMAHPLEIAIWHFLKHDPAVYIVGVDLHYVRRMLRRVVLRAS